MPDVIFYRDETLPFLEAKYCTRSDLTYQKHFHEEYSIGLIDVGETNAWCDGTMYEVEAGKVISFPPHMLHACHPKSPTSWRYKMLFIKQDWLKQLEPTELEQLRIPFLLEGDKNQSCQQLVNQVMESLSLEEPLVIETGVVELIHALVNWDSHDFVHSSRNRLEQKYIGQIREYLHAHYTERVMLEELEKAVGISRFHLIRLFKKGTHVPPHAYQNLLRINHAKHELAKSRPIAEIAVETGFYDQSHFSRAFAKIVGVTPQRYASSR
ncbi:AraC family transcriptional regulator [Brevibacillus reuszeri]|uniref:AraC family transcriptional regulator n=1 Tax=Brevibacillus reuszeri TaxID=54915 RepID=UPI00289A4E55|nr:AraC family transcriptional regulator [Brevibacillus reuszeri]